MLVEKQNNAPVQTKNMFIGMIVFVFGWFFGNHAHADGGVSIASGYGAAHIVPIRLGIQKPFNRSWREEWDWPISGYWEASVYNMNGRAAPKRGSHKRLQAIAGAAVMRFARAEPTAIGWPYVELGIGLSYLSRKEIGGRDLGIHFQFEDRVGVGIRLGEQRQYDIGYKAIHFSNAYIGPSNHGINLHLIALNYWFK
jgi:lipid A 3-O-deacylase